MLQLLEKSRKPDFDTFYQDNYDRTLAYIRYKITNFHDAQDLASEVFLYCYSHYSEYDPEKSAPATWLYLVVNSRLKNYFRDRKEHVDLDEISAVLPDCSPSLDSCLYLEQLHDTLMQAISRLPQRQQEIVTMRYMEEKSHQEIALALGITPGNARVVLSRALRAIEQDCKELLRGEFE